MATALRSDEAFRGVKIVALTAWGDVAFREKNKAAGFDLHIIKPADYRNLLDIAQ